MLSFWHRPRRFQQQNKEIFIFRGRLKPFPNGTTLAIRIRFKSPIHDGWAISFPLRLRNKNKDHHVSWAYPISLVELLPLEPDINTIHLRCMDPSDDNLNMYDILEIEKYRWKNDFENLEEIVVVLRKEEGSEDGVSFEHNLIINKKRICNSKQFYSSDFVMLKGSVYAGFNVAVRNKNIEEGNVSKHFLIEVNDLGRNELY